MKNNYIKILLVLCLMFIGGAIDHYFFLPKIKSVVTYEQKTFYIPVNPRVVIIKQVRAGNMIIAPPVIFSFDSAKISWNKFIDSIETNVVMLPYRIAGTNLFIVSEFEDKLDTIIDKDTLNLSYSFPNRLFDLEIRQPADTVKITIPIKTTTNTIESAWYDKFYIGSVAGALFVGILSYLVK